MPDSSVTQVAVGVLLNGSGEVLISLRHPDSHQGGLWEFPGGKLEAGEECRSALKREFAEELGIEIINSVPYTQIRHHYADKSVLLDVRLITEHRGQPAGLEGQAIAWRALDSLQAADFPAANLPIIKRLQLPPAIAITPDCDSFAEMEEVLHQLLLQPLKIIQFRQTQLDDATYLRWFAHANTVCKARQLKLMFNHSYEAFLRSGAADYHANAATLMGLRRRPVESDSLFSASCHDLEQLQQAENVGADLVYLSPVCYTDKYTSEKVLGWERFQTLVSQTSTPVYALGGVDYKDCAEVRLRGGAGISGIRAFLPSN